MNQLTHGVIVLPETANTYIYNHRCLYLLNKNIKLNHKACHNLSRYDKILAGTATDIPNVLTNERVMLRGIYTV